MIDQTLALVRRSLRVDARGMQSHLLRATMALVVLLQLFLTWTSSQFFGAAGQSLFYWIVYTNYWFVTLAGASLFAASITTEKEERTLSLLKLANVSPLSVLLGKWIPLLIGGTLLIAVQIPFTVLSVTLGGVLWNQIIAVYATLFAHLFLVGNLGLFCSVIMRRTGTACGLAVAVLLIMNVLPTIVQGAVTAHARRVMSHNLPATAAPPFPVWMSDACEQIQHVNAFAALSEILSTTFAAYWIPWQVLSNLVLGGMLFGCSWMLFDYCTRNDSETASESRLLSRIWKTTSRSSRAPQRAWAFPIIGKDFRQYAGGVRMLVLKFVAYGLLIAGVVWLDSFDDVRDGLILKHLGEKALWTSLPLLIIEFPILTSRLYRDEILKQTWPVLMTLPRSLPEIAYAKLLGGLLALLPGLIWLGFGLLSDEKSARALIESFSGFRSAVIWAFWGLVVLLIAQIATLLSITIRWAAWPVAIFSAGFGVFMFTSTFLVFLFAMNLTRGEGPDGAFVFACCVYLIANGIAHTAINLFLQRAAAQ